ncbi:ATP-dependent sacrificial sulfur transferase LarE [Pelosinus sp. sgz500959]|uniref:ATP-dependent sacrificial sulfur transferase LarE n=1 Tax=Pelosinus sp. sgz500959 TaxID=3242472 RepID=UPI0036713C82
MGENKEKIKELHELLSGFGSVVVAFSGGVDSSFLAAAALRAVGEKAVAVTAFSETLAESEKDEAILLAKEIGIKHILLNISELNSPDFVENTTSRCYHCKKERFSVLATWAKEHGYNWILEGSNADDLSDYRPGIKAVEELEKVRSPLLEVGLTKGEIREISKEWNLPTWDKLSAACLSSRVAYGIPVTAERLKQIEMAEELVKRFCSGQVRVRHHGNIARIEVAPENIERLAAPEIANILEEGLKEIGFTYVTLDLAGYRMGSMNANI